ncbi:MAG: hypothetical protein EPN84_08335 [Legionella sp.]|nr:MAG: hypothetical protein EPN84_08335 [Legionella sp.]
MKKTLIAMMASTLLTPCYANITLVSRMEGGCEQIPGRWVGTGKANNWLIGECVYHGEGQVSELDVNGRFTLQVSAEKDSGSFLCPQHNETQLNGLCVGNAVIFITNYGNLDGSYVDKVGSAKGTLTASAGMSVDVDIQFHSES